MREGELLMASGQYQMAGIFFEKCLYETDNQEIKAKALMKKADCCIARLAYSDASRVLSRFPYAGLGDTLSVLARQKSALAAYLSGDFPQAESQLMQAISLVDDSSLTLHLISFQALVLNEQQKWEEAKAALHTYLLRKPMSEEERRMKIQLIDKQYDKRNIPKLKNPEKAKMLSTFLPGLGYLYAGNWSEGIWNVGLQALGLGLTGVGVFYQFYFTSAFVSISIFQKFYAGGITRSAYHARKWNYEKSQAFNKANKDLILRLLKTEKAP